MVGGTRLCRTRKVNFLQVGEGNQQPSTHSVTLDLPIAIPYSAKFWWGKILVKTL